MALWRRLLWAERDSLVSSALIFCTGTWTFYIELGWYMSSETCLTQIMNR